MNIFAILALVAKRILNNIGLVLFNLLGLVIAVVLLSSLPLYAEAANERSLQEDLEMKPDERRPKSSLLFQYSKYLAASADPSLYRRADGYVMLNTEGLTGMTAQEKVRYARSSNLPVYPSLPGEVPTYRDLIDYMPLAFLEGLEEHINIMEGRYPRLERTQAGEIEVLLSARASAKLAVNPGDSLLLIDKQELETSELHLKVVGVWEAKNPEEPYWFYSVWAFDNNLLMPEKAFMAAIQSLVRKNVGSAAWYFLFAPKDFHFPEIPRVLGAVSLLGIKVPGLLPGTRISGELETLLRGYLWKTFVLKILLYVFSVPVVFIILYYVVLSSSMMVDRQGSEIAVLKSRGTSNWQLIGIYLLEGLLLGAVALAIGPLLGMFVAQLIGKTYTFLSFVNRNPLPVTLTPSIYRYAIVSVGLFVIASLLPAMSTARHSVVTYQREISRVRRPSFWQRYFFDLVLLAISLYGYYSLRARGRIFALSGTADPFKNPLLLLLPTLFIFSLALVFTRFFPVLVEAIARLGGRFFSVPVMLGLRYLARMPFYHPSLVLVLILTLSLGTFYASAAETLDQNYTDQVLYRTGGDLRLVETGLYDPVSELWEFIPVQNHLLVPGVKKFARIHPFSAYVVLGDRRSEEESQLLGIDRFDFSQVAWFREDFASQSFGTLMNILASSDDALLISRSFFNQYPLGIGDGLILHVADVNIYFQIVGIIDYFPTLYPERGHFFVGNLDYIAGMTGYTGYDVLLETDRKIDSEVIVEGLEQQDFVILAAHDSRVFIEAQRSEPTRTGLFGLLSVGFVISAFVTTLGFLLYSIVSLDRRTIQLGILRAMGFSVFQLVSMVIFEQAFLVFIGTIVGTLLGLGTGHLFIPFLQIGTSVQSSAPPFVVVTAWNQIFKLYIILAGTLVMGLAVMIWLLLRIKIYQVVKLGEEQV